MNPNPCAKGGAQSYDVFFIIIHAKDEIKSAITQPAKLYADFSETCGENNKKKGGVA